MLPSRPLSEWLDRHARSLPWRGESATPWRVLVSEFMLQQTPVSRVVPRFESWVARWPDPAALARAPGADVLREWGSLGYPRRAMWLRESALRIVTGHGGRVPDTVEALLSLPGVGDYTARAVLAFGFGRRVPVVDTNVRRVLARHDRGVADSPVRQRTDMAELEPALPRDGARAAHLSLAIMELGALVCTARAPKCALCPIADSCLWKARGYPEPDAPTRVRATYSGSDREARGRILAALRRGTDAIPLTAEEVGWPDTAQFSRAIDSLAADGLIVPVRSEEDRTLWRFPD